MKQFVWYAIQTGIVVGIVYFDSTRPHPTPGAALFLGVGWALSFTVVVHLIGNGFRRLWRWFVPVPHVVGERRNDGRGIVADR